MSNKNKTYLLSSLQIQELSEDKEYIVEDKILFKEIRLKYPNVKVYYDENQKDVPSSFLKENNFQKELYKNYLIILTKRLNKIHNKDFSVVHWEKVIGLEILMHIHHCRSIYKTINKIENKNYEINILDKNTFQVPFDNSEYRFLSQHSLVGYEQLISIYYNLKKINKSNFMFKGSNHINGNYNNEFKFLKDIFNRLKNKKISDLFTIAFRRFLVYFLHLFVSPRVLLVETIFSDRNFIKLMLISFGKIQLLNKLDLSTNDVSIDNNNRETISLEIKDGNDFDQFFFKSLFYFAPKSWIENYDINEKKIINKLNYYKKLKTIVSESSSEISQLISAYAGKKGIEVYYNEHNLLQHYLIGNLIWFLDRRYDKYLSLGWKGKENSILPLGSLYNWKIKEQTKKEYKFLFISSVASNKSPLHSAIYGEQGINNAISYFEITKEFFQNLSNIHFSNLYFRGHPHVQDAIYKDYAIQDGYMLKELLDKCMTVDYSRRNSAVDLISKSEIVIINYLSTPWLQSLVSNVPTIIIWNKNTYFLDNKYIKYFDKLIENNIVFENGKDAAHFIDQIHSNPKKWWFSSEVQSARKQFLNENFMQEEKLTSYLLSLA